MKKEELEAARAVITEIRMEISALQEKQAAARPEPGSAVGDRGRADASGSPNAKPRSRTSAAKLTELEAVIDDAETEIKGHIEVLEAERQVLVSKAGSPCGQDAGAAGFRGAGAPGAARHRGRPEKTVGNRGQTHGAAAQDRAPEGQPLDDLPCRAGDRGPGTGPVRDQRGGSEASRWTNCARRSTRWGRSTWTPCRNTTSSRSATIC